MSGIVDDFVSALDQGQRSGFESIEKLMDLILAKARRHTSAEAGSIFIVRENDRGEKELQACSLQNDRVRMSGDMFTIPVNKSSIAGYVAATGDVVEIEDLYEISPNMPYSFNRTFDDRDGYRSQSMLAFPLKSFTGDVIGVVQLLNHIDGVSEVGHPRYGVFPMSYVDDVKTLVTVLGAMVERAHLLAEIDILRKEVERLREG